jgi:hypothetical protein
LTQFVTFKRAGESGRVAVNPAMVTELRSTTGPFIDIHFGDHRVAVEGTLQQVIAMLSTPTASARETPLGDSWLGASASRP